MLLRARAFFDRLTTTYRTFGAGCALDDLALSIVNRAAYVRILKCVVVDSVSGPLEECRYAHGFVDRERLLEWSRDPAYEIDAHFLAGALDKGDRCYGIWEGDTLASYGWYSNRPTAVNDDLVLSFDPAYVYMYKGFTHPRYRGQRLHAIGMSLALRASLQQGFRGLLSYVESNNFASLKSCYRMGYRDVGWIGFIKALGSYSIHASGGCRQYDLRLEQKSTEIVPALA
jgi:hypothetical protein